MELPAQMKNETRNGPGAGRKNIYMCRDCGHGYVSQDVDEGVTPFMTACLNPSCKSMAESFFYKAPQSLLENFPAALEWYKPSFVERKKLSAATQRHVSQGGLISRPTTPKGGDA